MASAVLVDRHVSRQIRTVRDAGDRRWLARRLFRPNASEAFGGFRGPTHVALLTREAVPTHPARPRRGVDWDVVRARERFARG